ncbi:MAG: hypothetical protein KAW67_04140, partial [Candidatus Eisenbacteria sp.]|nr:hypothetical protein [Candidatus Eisenbacteria bacterium]
WFTPARAAGTDAPAWILFGEAAEEEAGGGEAADGEAADEEAGDQEAGEEESAAGPGENGAPNAP